MPWFVAANCTYPKASLRMFSAALPTGTVRAAPQPGRNKTAVNVLNSAPIVRRHLRNSRRDCFTIRGRVYAPPRFGTKPDPFGADSKVRVTDRNAQFMCAHRLAVYAVAILHLGLRCPTVITQAPRAAAANNSAVGSGTAPTALPKPAPAPKFALQIL